MTQQMGQKIQVSKIVVPIIVLLMVTVYLYAPIKEVSTWGISIFALLSAMLIFCFAQNPHTESRSILSNGVAWIGQRSYEMYLFHLIILGLFKVFYFPK